MAEHSPEPWTIRGKEQAVIMATHPDSPSELVGVADCRTVDVSKEVATANADRIVACVNFCAGTATEYLDGAGNLGRMLATAGAGVNAELLAACQMALDYFVDEYAGEESQYSKVLRAAIASATTK